MVYKRMSFVANDPQPIAIDTTQEPIVVHKSLWENVFDQFRVESITPCKRLLKVFDFYYV